MAVILQSLILIGGAWFLLNKFYKQSITTTNVIINEPIQPIKSIIKGKYKNNEKFPETIYSSNQKDNIVRKSDGDLIPFNLSDREKDLLNMFYSND